MKKNIMLALVFSSLLLLNGCRSTDKNIPKTSTESVIGTENTTGNGVIEESKPEIKETVIEKVVDTTIKDTDVDGIPDYVDEKPNQHITQTIAESGSQKLIILDNMKINSDKLTADMIKLLDNVADVLSKESNLKIRIVGHTCDLGTDKYNMELSKKRAFAANNYLLSEKVDKNKIQVDWKGEKNPIVKNDSESNRSKNRRIEIVFYSDDNK